ncbi:uncharacterized protein CTRU02_205248 [Colletotrichum truncatum]|uniref:Integral membrane protein n=1 Tax=Colletotrichum truncatum TaxID=5467 RepID=A0ACC3Z3G4_COLTU
MGWTYGTSDDVLTDGPRIAAVSITVTSIALILVCLRWYVRTTVVKAVGYGEFCRDLQTREARSTPFLDNESNKPSETKWGLGIKIIDDMPPQNVLQFGKVSCNKALTHLAIGLTMNSFNTWVVPCKPYHYVLGIWGFKMSLLFSYLRFFPAGPYRITTIIVATACTMGHIAFICVFLFLCTPIEKQYDPTIPPEVGHCVDAIAFYLSFSSLTIVFDVVIMLLPFPVILTSQIQRRKKYVLLGLFILGVFVTVIQAIRIQTIQNLVNYLDSARAIEWSIVETDTGIIIACIPTLAPLVKYFAEKSRSSTAGGSGQKSSRYALQSWRTARTGMQPLGTGVDRETSVSASRATEPDDSTDNILEPAGITKRTEVHVSAQDAWTGKEDRHEDQRV